MNKTFCTCKVIWETSSRSAKKNCIVYQAYIQNVREDVSASNKFEIIWQVTLNCFTPTFIFCSPICPNNCSAVFCENIF